jgi:hypothetical protein
MARRITAGWAFDWSTVVSYMLGGAAKQKQTTASPSAQTIEANKVVTHDVCAAVNEYALNNLYVAVATVAKGRKMTELGGNGQDLVQAGFDSIHTGLANGSLVKIAAGQTVTVHAIAKIPDIPKMEGTCVSNITYQGKDYLIFVFPNTFE